MSSPPGNSADGEPSRKPREGTAAQLSFSQIILCACAIGVGGGLLATGYYYVMVGGLWLVWQKLGSRDWLHLPFAPGWRLELLLIPIIGGLLVGTTRRIMGSPGGISAVVNNIHMEGGRIDPHHTPSMTITSLFSIIFGGSAGPEAPLVEIIGSLGSLISERLKLRDEDVRTLTFCGMGAALGAFFGAPLGGAIFSLEIPHRRGLEYYEALLPTTVAAFMAFFVFRSIVGYSGAIYPVQRVLNMSVEVVAYGVAIGVIGGIIGIIFVKLFQLTEMLALPLKSSPILLGVVGGIGIGLIAQISPKTLFWGEYQIESLVNIAPQFVRDHGLKMAVIALLALAFLKMTSISVTLQSGFAGGFIFPLFFIGACVGGALNILLPQVPLTVAVVCMMAAVNVAVTKTPISTSLILVTLTGASMLPVVTAASFASFLLTTRVRLIRGQRSRAKRVVLQKT